MEKDNGGGVADAPGGAQKGPPTEAIHIFVNRRKFGVADGVVERMTGSQIAALVGVPGANAVVRRETGPAQGEVGADQEIELRQAEHFLVTRRTVEGGFGPAMSAFLASTHVRDH